MVSLPVRYRPGDLLICRRCLRQKWILWYAILLHAIWGLIVILSPDALMTTPLHGFDSSGLGRWGTAVMLLGASAMALLEMGIISPTIRGAILMAPQQMLLLIGAMGAFGCIVRGSYADGVQRPLSFLLADQLPAILAAVLHTLAMLEFFAHRLWRRLVG
jgi:hypothetical protein